MTRSMTDRADMVVTPRIDFDFRGLRLSGLDLDDAIQWITEWAHARMRAIVVTPNINHLHLVQSSEEARDAMGEQIFNSPIVWPIVAASRILGHPLPARVAGIDMVERLVDGDNGFKVAILGGPSDAASPRLERVRRRNQVVLVDELRPDEIATNRVRAWPSELSRPPRI